MSNELNFAAGVTGLTVTAQLYTAGAASGSPISCPEISTTGIYTGTMAGAAATYGVAFLASAVVRGYGQIIWDGTAEVTPASVMTRIGVAGAGLTALGDTRIANLDAAVSTRSTYAGGAVASVTGSVGSVVGLTASNLDATVSSRSTYAGGAVASVTAVVSADVKKVNGVTVTGTGTEIDYWRPA